MKKKSLLMVVLAALLVISLVACDGKTDESSQPSDDKDKEQVESDEKDSEESDSSDAKDSSDWNVERPEGVPEDYPNKDIEYIYGFGPGSVQDAYIRILFEKAAEKEGWKNAMFVRYKEGASGKIGWNAIAKAKPDGYTVGFVPTAMMVPAVAEAGTEAVQFGLNEYSYIFNMMSDPGVIGVSAESEYNTLEDLVKAAIDNPGEITVGVTSTIGQEGLTVKQIQNQTGAKFNITAFDSEPQVLTAVVGGHLDAYCLNVTNITTFLENGQVKALATGGTERSEFLPEVPTYKEAGYDITQINMRGVAGPKDMPEPIRQYLENCLVAAANDPDVKEQIKDMQIPLDTLTGAQMKEKFDVINASYEELWKASPWQ